MAKSKFKFINKFKDQCAISFLSSLRITVQQIYAIYNILHHSLSDFGLAKDGPAGDKSHVSTRIMGTYGYAAPEYMATGHLTARSDVYSFGVVLLEILSGRRAMDKNRPSREQNLVEWAKPYLKSKRKVFQIIDSHIEGEYPLDAARKVAYLAQQCLSTEPKLRPRMNAVVKAMEQLQDEDEDESFSLGSQIGDVSLVSDHGLRNGCQGKSVEDVSDAKSVS